MVNHWQYLNFLNCDQIHTQVIMDSPAALQVMMMIICSIVLMAMISFIFWWWWFFVILINEAKDDNFDNFDDTAKVDCSCEKRIMIMVMIIYHNDF